MKATLLSRAYQTALSQWWDRFIKAWRKIGNVYKNHTPPPAGLEGCEHFTLPDHAPLEPQATIPTSEQQPPSVEPFVRSCFTKNRYSTEDLANAVAIRCWYARGTNLRAYACVLCGGWHLTSKNAPPRMQANWRPPRISEDQRNPNQRDGRRRPRRRFS